MVEQQEQPKRKKITFLRRDWYKKIKFGKGNKKNQKWRAAKGRQNKTRLGRRGYAPRPKVGYGASNETKNTIRKTEYTIVYNINDIEQLQEASSILIANVGKKKRNEIQEAAKNKKITILNKYKENANELNK